MKIKFERYDIKLHGYEHCVLIPRGTEQLWITNYGNKDWGVDFNGNRKAIEAILYLTVILGFNREIKSFISRSAITLFRIHSIAKTESIV